MYNLAPEFDPIAEVIRVGGRLRHSQELAFDTIHPIILDSRNSVVQLLIAAVDAKLGHPGVDRVYAHLRRYYWILKGRQAVRKYQRKCLECAKWKGKPIVPRMADLPPSKLNLFKPPFWSTGMDCFGPFVIKSGRKTEKRWGLLFKCQTTRCVH